MKEKIKDKKTIGIIISIILVILLVAIVIISSINPSGKNEIQQGNEKLNKTVEELNDGNKKEANNENKEEGKNTSTNKEVKAEEVKVVLQDDEKVHIEQDASGDKVPVPRGYVGSSVASENEIDTGYVIYEGEEPVTQENVEVAQTTRNQFVWVPVPDPSQMYGTDSKGKKWGKLYNFNKSTGAVTNNNWSESNGVMRISSNTGCREPDILKDRDKDSQLKTYGIGVKSMNDFNMDLQKEFNSMIKSVEKYGGFYIGRYETGNLSQNIPVVVKGNTDISNQNWYKMYDGCKRISGGNQKVKTGIIWGCQWDATLKWFQTSSDENVEKYVIDSTGMGNYTGSKKATGSSEDYKVNNIYDMAGNVWDRTMEANSTYLRVSRRWQF